jgi:hypothetical protein
MRMAESDTRTKSALVEETEAAWRNLHSYLEGLSESQLTSLFDDQGWTVKDHLTHLAAWEASVIAFLQGRPRSEGLGVDEALYSRGSFDEINAAIREQHTGLSHEEAIARMRATHSRLLTQLDSLKDDDLVQPLRHFLAASPPDDERSAIDLIRGNTSEHYTQHLGWIRSLVDSHDAE